MKVKMRLGTALKKGAAAGPQAMVILASGCSAIRCASNPEDKIASPTRVEVINKIFIQTLAQSTVPPHFYTDATV